jgi:hypothetical protein
MDTDKRRFFPSQGVHPKGETRIRRKPLLSASVSICGFNCGFQVHDTIAQTALREAGEI